jgi:hypothetical protein
MVVAAAFLLPGTAASQDRDTQEVQRYVMTDAALAKYKAATKKLVVLPGAGNSCDDEENTGTIAEAVAKIDAMPGAKAAITSSGMTAREYVVFSFAILHNGLAAWAVSQPGGKLPPGISQANVDFYKKHAAEIESLPKAEEADCNEEGAEDDYSE